ncbi:MAG: nuclear transport factor 2 family protein [Acidimicrobiia bacterium]
MSERDVEIMRRWVEDFTAGNLVGVMEAMHPEVVVNEGEGLPWPGDHVGRDGFQRLLETILSGYELSMDSCELADAGAFVVARMQVTFTSRVTGRAVPMPVVELWELRDGLIYRGDVFYKDTKAIADAHAEALAST